MLDATIAAKDIKQRYSYQAIKKLNEKENDDDLLKAIYKSTMEEDMGKDEQFIDAPTSPKLSAALISTVPRSKEEHENYNKLNGEFSERIEKINDSTLATSSKSNKDTEMEKDNLNENKKRVATDQGNRDDFDNE
ncbi:hypothetical protein C1646_756312 [Rhizophagus diaphanus]|nr:hypothetical protein C1646_756312 [Rhizophagus diaphanus] [Rhizophagus sp. MUCL 43196]